MDRTPTSLDQLKRCVALKIASRWNEIGIKLKFKVEELDQINQNNKPRSVDECCIEMLQLWNRTTGIKTNQLIDAIEEAGDFSYASQLRQGTICKHYNFMVRVVITNKVPGYHEAFKST